MQRIYAGYILYTVTQMLPEPSLNISLNNNRNMKFEVFTSI